MPKIETDVVLALGEHLPAVDVWLVVDVLRASTVIVRWFELGGGALMPVGSTSAARRLAASLAKNGQTPLLMGEENAIAPKGFDLGNSPMDLTEALVSSHSCAVMATTNGTGALLSAAATGVPVLAACIRNAGAVVTHALTLGSRIGILCAGRKRRPAWDDTLCAGLLLEELAVHEPEMLLTDSARLALLTLHSSPNLLRSMRGADHAIFLDKLGYGPDIEFACERNAATVVPVLHEEPDPDGGDSMRAILEGVTPEFLPSRFASSPGTSTSGVTGRSFAALLKYTNPTGAASTASSNRARPAALPISPTSNRNNTKPENPPERSIQSSMQAPFFLGGGRKRERIDRLISGG